MDEDEEYEDVGEAVLLSANFDDPLLNEELQRAQSAKQEYDDELKVLSQMKKKLEEERFELRLEKKEFREEKKLESGRKKPRVPGPSYKKVSLVERRIKKFENNVLQKQAKKNDAAMRYSLAVTENIRNEVLDSIQREKRMSKMDPAKRKIFKRKALSTKLRSVTLETLRMENLRTLIGKKDRQEIKFFDNEKDLSNQAHDKRKSLNVPGMALFLEITVKESFQ